MISMALRKAYDFLRSRFLISSAVRNPTRYWASFAVRASTRIPNISMISFANFSLRIASTPTIFHKLIPIPTQKLHQLRVNEQLLFTNGHLS